MIRLTAASIAAGHMVRAADPPTPTRPASAIVSAEQAPAP